MSDRLSNLSGDECHFVRLAVAGVAVLFIRGLATGDKLSRQLAATVAPLIGSIDSSLAWTGQRSQRVIIVTIRSDESTGRPALDQSRTSSTMSSSDVMTSGGPATTIMLLVAEETASDSAAQS